MRILVVDDHLDLLTVTASALQSFGFDVLQASGAEQALDLLHDPDQVEILFTDVVMPGMSGVDLAYRARQQHEGLCVILTSGYTPPETAVPPSWQFIQKPYRMDELLSAIRKAS